LGWSVGALAVVVLGLGARLAIGGTAVGDRSALAMGVLLTAGTWLAARLLAGPRTALLVTLAAVALLNIAALPPRDPPPYDDLEAFYRTDQVLGAQVALPSAGASTLSLLVQPVFSGAQPRFGLAGDVNGTPVAWSCPLSHGIHWITLPVSVHEPSASVQLHLTGSPSRDGDYLIVYASSRQGGYLVYPDLTDQSATRCSAA
jgi:hypothetical protein